MSLAKALKRSRVLTEYKLSAPKKREDKGYYAYHFKVASKRPEYRHLLCEIQIKTLLHDSWSAKTHDLTYKPQGEIDDELEEHMKILGEVLALLDTQSEIIKNLIKEEWMADKSRKVIAKQEMLSNLLAKRTSQKRFDQEVVALANEIELNSEHFTNATSNDKQFVKVHEKICDLAETHGYDIKICSLLTLLASLRESGDLNKYTLITVDRWKANAKNGVEKFTALLFKAAANYAFGDFSAAVSDASEVLQYSEEKKLGSAYVSTAKMNLCYFLAEKHFRECSHKDR